MMPISSNQHIAITIYSSVLRLPVELGQASVLYSPVCHSRLKNKIKLVLLNYLLSAKSRRFSLREKRYPVNLRPNTQSNRQWRRASAHRRAAADERTHTLTLREIQRRIQKCSRAHAHNAWWHTLAKRASSKTRGPHSQTLVACHKSVISCLEDVIE